MPARSKIIWRHNKSPSRYSASAEFLTSNFVRSVGSDRHSNHFSSVASSLFAMPRARSSSQLRIDSLIADVVMSPPRDLTCPRLRPIRAMDASVQHWIACSNSRNKCVHQRTQRRRATRATALISRTRRQRDNGRPPGTHVGGRGNLDVYRFAPRAHERSPIGQRPILIRRAVCECGYVASLNTSGACT